MNQLQLQENHEEDQVVIDLIRVIRLCRPTRLGDGCLVFDPAVHHALVMPEWAGLERKIARMRESHSEAWWAWVKTEEARDWRRHFLRVHELTCALRMREVAIASREELQGARVIRTAGSIALVAEIASRLATTAHPRPINRLAEQIVEAPENYSHVSLLAMFYAAFHHRADVALGAWHFAEWKAGMRPFFQTLARDGVRFPEGVTADDVDHFLADNPGGFLHHVRAWTAGGEIAGMSISSVMERDV